jgi:isocitrate/isopropylmalate dehydrogenase
VLPGDGVGPEIVGAALDMLREADRIFGLGLTFETAAIGFDSLRTAGTPSRIVVRLRPRDDLSTKGFSGAFTGKLAPTAQGKCGEHNSSKQEALVMSLRCVAERLLLEVRDCKRTFRFHAYDIGSYLRRAAGHCRAESSCL